jgi:aminoglycoside/choline kinase family phosphotransferase
MQATDNSLAPLAETLRKRFPTELDGAVSLKVEVLSGDASSRRYYRIHSDSHRYVLQVDQAFPEKNIDSHPYISALKLFDRLNMPVPKFCGVAASEGWILMQDLGDVTLQQRPEVALYEEAIDLLVRLVCEGEEFRRQKFDTSYSGPHFGWAFDETKLSQEMAYTAKHLVQGYFGDNPDTFQELIRPTVLELDRAPRFLCHRDYHCRNLMVQDSKLWVIDFQDARLGPLSYDVVSLLWDPYVQIPLTLRDKLLAHWETSLRAAASSRGLERVSERIRSGSLGDSGALRFELERMKVQRLLKAAGSYASFYFLKGRTDYLPSIEPALRSTVEALKTLLGNARWATREDERLLTLLEAFLTRDSAIIEKR